MVHMSKDLPRIRCKQHVLLSHGKDHVKLRIIALTGVSTIPRHTPMIVGGYKASYEVQRIT